MRSVISRRIATHRARLALLALFALLAPFAASLAQGQEIPPDPVFVVEAFEVRGENPLSAGETQSVLAPFLGEHSGFVGLEAAADALQALLGRRGYAFHRVIVPPQTADAGVFAFEVLAFKLSGVEVRGNQHFSSANILQSLPGLVPGTVPNRRDMSGALRLANQHAAKSVRVTMRESTEPDHLDAVVEVEDRNPLQGFAAFNNRGSDETGRTRATIGGQFSNFYDLDHSLLLTGTVSPGRIGDVHQFGAFYRAPFYYLGGVVEGFFADSNVDIGTIANAFDVSGGGTFLGIRYTHLLPTFGGYSQDIGIALEDHNFETVLTLAGVNVGTNVSSRPLSARYVGNYQQTWGSAGFYVEPIVNLAGGSNNNQVNYTANGADRDWRALRYGMNADYASQGWLVRGRVTGQVANGVLIAGEQFGIGGATSVRGYEEREASGDDGTDASLEVWSPMWFAGARFLAFLDYGRVRLESTTGGPDRLTLSSLGIGVRWSARDDLDVSIDGAHTLTAGPQTESGDQALHFSLLYRFF